MKNKNKQSDMSDVTYNELKTGRQADASGEAAPPVLNVPVSDTDQIIEIVNDSTKKGENNGTGKGENNGTGQGENNGQDQNGDKGRNKKKRRIRFFTDRRFILALADAGCFLISFFIYIILSSQLIIGQQFRIFIRYIKIYWPCALVLLIFAMAGRLLTRVYKNVWRYPNIGAYRDMIISDFISGIAGYTFTRLVLFGRVEGGHIGLWPTVSVFAIFAMITLMLRFVYQLFCRSSNFHRSGYIKQEKGKITRVGIVGAGQLGVLLADKMISDGESDRVPCCFFEINSKKIGCLVSGLEVFGEDELGKRARELNLKEIVVAIPGLSPKNLNRLCMKYADETGCRVRSYGYSTPQGMIKRLTEEDYNTLLGRSALTVNNDDTRMYYRDRVVLVTGGGGSIGSELCRQIAKCQPKQLIVLDIYENTAYELQMELLRKYEGALNLVVEIASVRDVDRLDAIFDKYRPDIVFHAAAHKHVPLMEHSGVEAVKNNVIGTYNTANVAEKYGVKKFVLVSTDKAVRPTNIMGASKQMCEMVIQCRTDSKTVFTAVRFGNVLGSHGSVIPLFQEQIAKGGPVTVTHRDIVRYFMTIPEASQLVMQAGSMAQSGELYVLNMGSPVKIWSLAENLISMSGYVPGKDIQIEETGLRPGEKMYEELLVRPEDQKKDQLIYVEKVIPLTRAEVDKKLDILRKALVDSKNQPDSTILRDAMKEVVPTFREAEEVNRNACESEEEKQAIDLTCHK